jgi:hypothetical protein
MASINNILNVNFLDITKITGLLNTKGQLLTHNATVLARLGVGTDGQILSSDSAEVTGLKWVAASTGTTFLGLSDTPGTYPAACADALLKVNSTPDAVEFSDTLHGTTTDTTNKESVTIGKGSTTTLKGVAVGTNADCTADETVAIGYGAKSRVDSMVNIVGPITIRKDLGTPEDGVSDRIKLWSGATVELSTEEIDFTATGSVTITVPAGLRFYPKEIRLLTTVAGTNSAASGSIEIGDSGDVDKYLIITNRKGDVAQYTLSCYTGFDSAVGTLSPKVNIATALANSGKFRAIWVGSMVEDE